MKNKKIFLLLVLTILLMPITNVKAEEPCGRRMINLPIFPDEEEYVDYYNYDNENYCVPKCQSSFYYPPAQAGDTCKIKECTEINSAPDSFNCEVIIKHGTEERTLTVHGFKKEMFKELEKGCYENKSDLNFNKYIEIQKGNYLEIDLDKVDDSNCKNDDDSTSETPSKEPETPSEDSETSEEVPFFINYNLKFNPNIKKYSDLNVKNEITKFGIYTGFNLGEHAENPTVLNLFDNAIFLNLYYGNFESEIINPITRAKNIKFNEIEITSTDFDNSIDEEDWECNNEKTKCIFEKNGIKYERITKDNKTTITAHDKNGMLVEASEVTEIDGYLQLGGAFILGDLKEGKNELQIKLEDSDDIYTINIVREGQNKKTDNEISESPGTGSALIFIVWVIGFGALAYGIYYIKKQKNNEEVKSLKEIFNKKKETK